MAIAFKWDLAKGEDRDEAVRRLLREALEKGAVDAVLVPAEGPARTGIVNMFTTDPGELDVSAPFAKAMAQFGPHDLVRLTEPGGSPIRIAALLKPCECRAVAELAKINQIDLENVVLSIGTFGVKDGLVLVTNSDEGQAFAEAIDAKATELTDARKKAVEEAIEKGEEAYGEQEAKSREKYDDMATFLGELSPCIKCMNCQNVCPVCYCRECLLYTDAFNPTAGSLADKAQRRGTLRMPVETVQFHLTRMAHVMTACVMCGQCQSACPSDIPLVEMYAGINRRIQDLFDYESGRSLEEEPPFTCFSEHENFKIGE